MRTTVGLWWLLVGFFLLMAVTYTTWSIIAHPDLEWYHGVEWVGTVALLFTVADVGADRLLYRSRAQGSGR